MASDGVAGKMVQHDALIQQSLLSTIKPTRLQYRLAGFVLLLLVLALLVAAPYADMPLEDTASALPAYAAAVVMNDLIVAALFLALYAVQRSRAILVLSIGYLFSGISVIPWALTFPDAFGPQGLLSSGLQTTAAIAAIRRLGFPLFILAYALIKDKAESRPLAPGPAWRVIATSILLVGGSICLLTWAIIAGERHLPGFMADSLRAAPPWRYVPAAALAIYAATLLALWQRRNSVLDLWLMVVICTLVIEILLISYLSERRLDLGWWAGRVFGLVSASVVLLVLLSETTALYARLIRSLAAERRVREERLVTTQALLALIAHEVNQPLTSIVTNAGTGLRWLERADPNADEARAALRRVVRDGHRAAEVIDGVRATFKQVPQERHVLDINQIVLEVLNRAQSEAQLERIAVQRDLGAGLPSVIGNRVQLQQVVSNIVKNASDAVNAVPGRGGSLRIQTRMQDEDYLLVSVSDNGTGLKPENIDRIFEPFFTTKANGMGMGLMFSRSIVEDHGGRLWAESNHPQGAIFQFTLPVGDAKSA